MKCEIVPGKNKTHHVKIFTLSTCGWCKKTKELLKENEIAHEYLDLDKCSREDQKAAVEHLKSKNLPVAFPVIMIDDDKVIQGFKKDDILEALGL